MSLTESDLVRCLQKAGCIGTVKMSFESGPYDIDRPSFNASKLCEAIESAATAPLLERIAELEKALKLVQQHHATAWNRGHIAGMAANRVVARDAMKAVEQDAWNNTQLTEALMAAETRAEQLERDLEALRKDAADADGMCKALAAVIDKDDARWKFLHTTNKDAEGFEWCVMRVKWENGRISEAWHTNQDLKDLDAAIDAAKEQG